MATEAQKAALDAFEKAAKDFLVSELKRVDNEIEFLGKVRTAQGLDKVKEFVLNKAADEVAEFLGE